MYSQNKINSARNQSIMWDQNLCEIHGINIYWLINSKNKSIDPNFLLNELKNYIKSINDTLILYYINETYILANIQGTILTYGLSKGESIARGCTLLDNERIILIDTKTIKREYYYKIYRQGNDDWENHYSGIFKIGLDNSLIKIEDTDDKAYSN